MKGLEQMRLLISSGDGPAECRRAVSHIIREIEREAVASKVACDVVSISNKEPSSAIIVLEDATAKQFADRWTGTIQWTCKSSLRPGHKRQNWFVGIFLLPAKSNELAQVKKEDVRFETFRAGGPGGQHQNTTDSAVRAVHLPTGTVAIARDGRSQHKNRQTAMQRLDDQMLLEQTRKSADRKTAIASLHKQLERGNPKRRFKGEAFKEVR